MKKIKRCRVTFYVTTKHPAEQMYLCGELRNAGLWIAKSATKMRLTDKGWCAVKMLPVGASFEYKFLRDADWSAVEKGIWGEEVANRTIVAQKGLVVVDEVPNWRMD